MWSEIFQRMTEIKTLNIPFFFLAALGISQGKDVQGKYSRKEDDILGDNFPFGVKSS